MLNKYQRINVLLSRVNCRVITFAFYVSDYVMVRILNMNDSLYVYIIGLIFDV